MKDWTGGRGMEGGRAKGAKVFISRLGSSSSAVECQVTAPFFLLGGLVSELQLCWARWATISWRRRPWWYRRGASRERDREGREAIQQKD